MDGGRLPGSRPGCPLTRLVVGEEGWPRVWESHRPLLCLVSVPWASLSELKFSESKQVTCTVLRCRTAVQALWKYRQGSLWVRPEGKIKQPCVRWSSMTETPHSNRARQQRGDVQVARREPPPAFASLRKADAV